MSSTKTEMNVVDEEMITGILGELDELLKEMNNAESFLKATHSRLTFGVKVYNAALDKVYPDKRDRPGYMKLEKREVWKTLH